MTDNGQFLPQNDRVAEFEIDRLFLERWSPRALDPKPIEDHIVKSLFEAAKWAMSCNNDQPWLFIYAVTKPDLAAFLELLMDGNRIWCKNAPLLGFCFARQRFTHDNTPNRWATFDCGAAWASLTFQARLHGLYTHGMAGFHREKVCGALGVPEEDYEPVCAFAVGRYGDYQSLPEKLREREKPSHRKPWSEVAMEGRFSRQK